ncbi:MAG: sporulation initiation factor Spo0A C-terminal domain-containing protein [Eubacteriales bacterium]
MNSNKISVLIIDDNFSFAKTMKESLESTNVYEVIDILDDGIAGLKMAFDKRPRVIIADLLIPNLDGKEISLMIEHLPDYNPIYIIYSSIHDDEIVKEVVKGGVSHYFVQPFDIDLFICRLNSLLNISASAKFSIAFGSNPKHDLYITETTKLLRKMGIPPHISGYHYLREAIILAAEDFGRINTMMNSIYKPIAYKNESTIARVERSMRHAIEVACDRCRVHTLEELFGNTIDRNKDKPSNREFIALFADKVLLSVISKRNGEGEAIEKNPL